MKIRLSYKDFHIRNYTQITYSQPVFFQGVLKYQNGPAVSQNLLLQ